MACRGGEREGGGLREEGKERREENSSRLPTETLRRLRLKLSIFFHLFHFMLFEGLRSGLEVGGLVLEHNHVTVKQGDLLEVFWDLGKLRYIMRQGMRSHEEERRADKQLG